MDPGIRSLVLSRLAADGADGEGYRGLVLAALSGQDALEAELRGASAEPSEGAARVGPALVGAFLREVEVEGFRGIGPARTLELRPGPGLTLVVGRNGSGKSSFAEGLEVLLTGDSLRWKERAAVWREGWRNLHHPKPSLRATFLVEGATGPCVVSRAWAEQADFESAAATAETPSHASSDLAELGWTQALRTHRPFLSYNELGSLLDEGPSKLYDALSSILGLEDLVLALGALTEARRSREKATKAVGDAAARLVERLREIDDPRAGQVQAALGGKAWDLEAVEAALGGSAAEGAGTDDVDVLRGLA